MTDTLHNMPRYIRNSDAFGWQGADNPNGPWRSISPPQSGTPFQTTNPMDDLRQASAEVSGVEVLSPAAQFVLDAYWKGDHKPSWTHQLALAAALRACADQVVPEPPAWEIGVLASADREVEIRYEILAIAAELEGATP